LSGLQNRISLLFHGDQALADFFETLAASPASKNAAKTRSSSARSMASNLNSVLVMLLVVVSFDSAEYCCSRPRLSEVSVVERLVCWALVQMPLGIHSSSFRHLRRDAFHRPATVHIRGEIGFVVIESGMRAPVGASIMADLVFFAQFSEMFRRYPQNVCGDNTGN
jgi:hypothetical protein